MQYLENRIVNFFNFNFIRKNLYEKKGRAWFWARYPWVKIQIVIKNKCLVGIRIQVFLINVLDEVYPTQTQFNIPKSRNGIMAQPNHVTNFHAMYMNSRNRLKPLTLSNNKQ